MAQGQERYAVAIERLRQEFPALAALEAAQRAIPLFEDLQEQLLRLGRAAAVLAEAIEDERHGAASRTHDAETATAQDSEQYGAFERALHDLAISYPLAFSVHVVTRPDRRSTPDPRLSEFVAGAQRVPSIAVDMFLQQFVAPLFAQALYGVTLAGGPSFHSRSVDKKTLTRIVRASEHLRHLADMACDLSAHRPIRRERTDVIGCRTRLASRELARLLKAVRLGEREAARVIVDELHVLSPDVEWAPSSAPADEKRRELARSRWEQHIKQAKQGISRHAKRKRSKPLRELAKSRTTT